MTGSFEPVGFGVHTLRYRQSSSVLAAVCSVESATCAQRFPNVAALRTPVHAMGFWGGAHRSAPTGGRAYVIAKIPRSRLPVCILVSALKSQPLRATVGTNLVAFVADRQSEGGAETHFH